MKGLIIIRKCVEGGNAVKKEILKISISAILFIIGLCVKFNNEIVNTIIFIISYLIIGAEIIIEAIKNILHGEVFDECFLMTVATVAAIVIGEYPEAVAVMLFYEIGELFQDTAVDKSRDSIENLAKIRADYANIKRGETIENVNSKDVKIGDVIIIKPGEKVPLDGVIVEGISTLDTSALTGESMPRGVEYGDKVLSGCINLNGVLTVKVEKEFAESTANKILELIENTDSKKAKSEKFITKFAKLYTPIVVILAIIIAIIPPVVFHQNPSEWVHRACTFLVVSCPCALVISIPLSFFGGIGAASRKGILIKGSTFIEDLAKSEIVVFDKTGTLTKGVFEVTKIVTAKKNILSNNDENEILEEKINHTTNFMSKDEILKFAAYAESHSNHPIAKSIVRSYGKEINSKLIKNIKEESGLGIIAKIENDEVIIGNTKIMEKYHINCTKSNEAGTIIYVAVNEQYVGYILISDIVKMDSKKTIKALKDIGIKETVMLTGDIEQTSAEVASKIEIDKYFSELLPTDKVKKMKEIEKNKSDKGKILFVGDGINDTPVLSTADIGIAMGALGSDAAIEAADVVIMTDEPERIVDAIKISKKILRIVIENIVFAIGVKVLVLILGALGITNMWEAVFADVGVSIIAIINSLRTLLI